MSASADFVVAGWDNFNNSSSPTATVYAAGVSGTSANVSFSNAGAEDRGSSSDTTWGSFDGNGQPADATIVGTGVNLVCYSGDSGSITLTIVNNGATDLDLANFHMDALAFRPRASRTFAVDVLAGSDITVGNVYTSAVQVITSLGTAPNVAQDQHDEFDISLAGLADSTLEVNGTAIIQVAFTGGTPGSGGHHLWVDNIAVSAIPEPATFSMLAVCGGAIMFMRRRFTM
jgi:hypothetical protein